MREERREEEERGVDCAVACCHALCCLVLWTRNLLFDALDPPQWFHVCLILVSVSSTFAPVKLQLFYTSSRAYGVLLCLVSCGAVCVCPFGFARVLDAQNLRPSEWLFFFFSYFSVFSTFCLLFFFFSLFFLYFFVFFLFVFSFRKFFFFYFLNCVLPPPSPRPFLVGQSPLPCWSGVSLKKGRGRSPDQQGGGRNQEAMGDRNQKGKGKRPNLEGRSSIQRVEGRQTNLQNRAPLTRSRRSGRRPQTTRETPTNRCGGRSKREGSGRPPIKKGKEDPSTRKGGEGETASKKGGETAQPIKVGSKKRSEDRPT